MTLAQRKVFRAVGKAHVRTALPIFTHNAVYRPDAREVAMKAAMAQLDVLEFVGVKPQSVAIGHLCCHDDPMAEVPKAVARRGAFIGFDRITFNNILPDEKRVQMDQALIQAGYADQLLLSSDIATCCESSFKTQGGPGFARALTVFSPMMIKAGIPESTIVRAFYVNNPRRFLAFVAKKT